MPSVDELNDLLGELIVTHSEISECARGLSSEALVSELRGAMHCLDNNLPLVPPEHFQKRAVSSLTSGEWEDLLNCLQACRKDLGGPNGSELRGPELDAVAVGVLWSCLLIREYEQRNRQEALQQPIHGPVC